MKNLFAPTVLHFQCRIHVLSEYVQFFSFHSLNHVGFCFVRIRNQLFFSFYIFLLANTFLICFQTNKPDLTVYVLMENASVSQPVLLLCELFPSIFFFNKNKTTVSSDPLMSSLLPCNEIVFLFVSPNSTQCKIWYLFQSDHGSLSN